MTVLYIIAIVLMSFAVAWSAFRTVTLIWKQEAAGAVGCFVAYLFNSLITYLLIDGLMRL